MERGVEIFVCINVLIIGLSHFFQAQVWIDFFKKLSTYGLVGSFINGFISLSFGAIIMSFHWIWEGIMPTIITCFGIAQVIKAAICFITPKYGLKSISNQQAKNVNSFKIGGVIFIILGVVLLFHLLAK